MSPDDFVTVTVRRGDLDSVLANAETHLDEWVVGGEDRQAVDHLTEAVTSPAIPFVLQEIVSDTEYRPCWEVFVDPCYIRQGHRGPALVVRAYTVDTYAPDQTRQINHAFPVPPQSWDRETWTHWLFDRLLDVESHEAAEFFRVAGERPFAPAHDYGKNPYTRYGRPMR